MNKEQLKISPIFYMGNKKKLILKGLTELFPSNIEMFVDLFGGSGIVSMNVEADCYVINDNNDNLYSFYDMFKSNTAQDIVSKVIENINTFGLSRERTEQGSPLANEYKQKYIKMRKHCNKTKDVIDLYTCIFYAFSQQMRFNSKGEFNMPFGNRAFNETNEEYIKNGCKFFGKDNVFLFNDDFRSLQTEKFCSNDFVYLDPPYINTTATYNENGGWSLQDEQDLYSFCEKLNENNIKWGMSNIFTSKGIENKNLIQWCEDKKWNVKTFDNFTYMACGKGNSSAKEVYICNY